MSNPNASGGKPRIARVFPQKTNMTPTDELAFYGPPGLFPLDVDEVHICTVFTWDIARALWLQREWARMAEVKVGGPAFRVRGGEFEPGLYLKDGMVITSRGCINNCWFCEVPKREGREIRTLPIRDGYNVLDDNLLACPEDHIRAVFAMLARQPQKPIFSGGLEAARLQPWMAEELRSLRPQRLYFAYDTPDDYEPLVEAGKMLRAVGFTEASHKLGCYTLIGFPHDRFDLAEQRLNQVMSAGFVPFAMLYRDTRGERDPQWGRFQREWVIPELIYRHKEECAA